jgi:hypothetical protein
VFLFHCCLQYQDEVTSPSFIASGSVTEKLWAGRKVLLKAFWDTCGILFIEFLVNMATVNADCYCTTLWYLKEAIQMKHRDLLTGKAILLHTSVHCRTASVTK